MQSDWIQSGCCSSSTAGISQARRGRSSSGDGMGPRWQAEENGAAAAALDRIVVKVVVVVVVTMDEMGRAETNVWR